MDVTGWLLCFFDALHSAVEQAHLGLDSILAKERFWRSCAASCAKPMPEDAAQVTSWPNRHVDVRTPIRGGTISWRHLGAMAV